MQLYVCMHRWRFSLHKFLESNPVQIAMCFLVLIDAGVVIAEILLDINAIRSKTNFVSGSYHCEVIVVVVFVMGRPHTVSLYPHCCSGYFIVSAESRPILGLWLT